MTACNPDNLTSFVDGALAEAEARRVEEHLAVCAPCAASANAHRRIKGLLAVHATAATVPAGLAAGIGAALDRLPPPSVARPAWRPWLGKAGFLAVVAGAGLWMSRPLWRPQPLDVQAVVWHHLHAANPPRDASIATSNPMEARRWLGSRLQEPATAPVLAAPMTGAGVCEVDGAPSAIWMYRAPEPVTVIEIHGRTGLPDWPASRGGFREGTYGGFTTVVWQERGKTLVMVSRLPADRLTGMVEHSP